MILINSNTRQFNVPGADLVFGVVADSDAERKYFQCPRYVGDGLDLAACFIRINYRNANGKTDFYLVDDMAIVGGNITFSWLLSPKVTEYRGQVKYVMCAVGPDLKLKWHTTQGTGQVMDGLEPDNSHVESQTADVVAQLIAMVEAQTSAVENTGADQVVAVKTAAKTAQDSAVTAIETAGAAVKASIPADYAALSDDMRKTAPGIVCSAEGEVITLNDASNQALRGMRIFGKSTQDGVPTPESPVEIVSIENPTVSVNEQTVSIPRTLPGIPVTSGGNYTDENGQQWICDEVDFERGVYVKRINIVGFENASGGWREAQPVGSDNYRFTFGIEKNPTYLPSANRYGMCNALAYNQEPINQNNIDNSIGVYSKGGVFVRCDTYDNIGEFVAWAKAVGLKVQYILATPIETPLSETELAAYRALHTNKPNTTILNDSGAYMSVDYTADTKLYIDNKIKEALL